MADSFKLLAVNLSVIISVTVMNIQIYLVKIFPLVTAESIEMALKFLLLGISIFYTSIKLLKELRINDRKRNRGGNQ
jgi:hypothetical protein